MNELRVDFRRQGMRGLQYSSHGQGKRYVWIRLRSSHGDEMRQSIHSVMHINAVWNRPNLSWMGFSLQHCNNSNNNERYHPHII